MKTNRVLLILAMLFFVITASAQVGINYKAIINDDNGDPLANSSITVQFTILENGTTNVYQETHNPTTDAHGIVIVNIGEGTPISDDFNTINWGSNPHFLKTEIDTGEGLTDMGTVEYKAVPYALYAKNAEGITGPITENQNLADVIAIDNSANSQIKNVTDPTEAQDAATKEYIDELIGQLYAQGALRIRDYDGNYYNTIKIGNQIWMSENLNVTHYADGNPIPLVEVSSSWDALVISDKAYCWYSNSETYSITFGALYTWAAAMNGASSSTANPSGIQGVCPDGWHLPSDSEWTELTDFIGGTSVAGDKLKETGTAHWAISTEATNETGFTALPGGERLSVGTFKDLRYYARFWTATDDDDDACYRWLYCGSSQVNREYYFKDGGFSVRCVKDTE